MNAELSSKVQEIAVYLGKPWKFNHLYESSWAFEIIDGTGRGLFLRIDGNKFRISGLFPSHKTYRSGNRHSIGVSHSRPAYDIAADIKRRFFTDYLESYEKAAQSYKDMQQKKANKQHMLNALRSVSRGQFYNHTEGKVYFKHGQAELWSDDLVRLELNRIPMDIAIRILGTINEIDD